MSHLFASQGRGTVASRGCDKSGALSTLIDALRVKYLSATAQALDGDRRDIAVIARGVNGLEAAIDSYGDPRSPLEQFAPPSRGQMRQHSCACCTRGTTVDWVNAFAPDYAIHFVAQTVVASNHSAINAATDSLARAASSI